MTRLLLTLTFCLVSASTSLADNRTLVSVEGVDVFGTTISGLQGDSKRPLVVVFLSAKCPCSNSHISELRSLFIDFKDHASFVGIHSNVDESPQLTKDYFKSASLPFPVIQDKKSQLADRFKALKTPHSFILSADGAILYQGGVSSSQHFDSADRKYLREALTDIQSGKSVRTPEGRTLGCAITRDEKIDW